MYICGKHTPVKIVAFIKNIYTRFLNLILYGIIGGLCAALDFAAYSLLCYFEILPYLWANVLSIHFGIFSSFILNRQLNFRVKDKTPQRFLSFYIVGLTGLGISTLLLWVLVDWAKWNEIVCKLVTIVFVALVQFILNKHITFKTNKRWKNVFIL